MDPKPSTAQAMLPIPSPVPVSNRDMFIGDDLLGLFPTLRPILHNPEVETFFARQEEVANKWKHAFVKWGSICLVIVCALLIILSWRVSLASLSIQLNPIIGYLAAAAGMMAVAIQIYLALSSAHSKWLYARFAAERTRLWKYQSFLDGNFLSLLGGSSEAFNKAFNDRWILFTAQFRGGGGGMDEFVESSPFELSFTPSPYVSPDIFQEARKAYQVFRLDVQKAHLAYKDRVFKAVDEWTDGAAKIFLLGSGVIVVIDACLVGGSALGWINHEGSEWTRLVTAILAGSALSLAIVSAGLRVYRSASGITEERERYRFKQLHLRRIDDQLKLLTDQGEVLALMARAETLCTEELQEFLRSLSRADYFL